MSINWNAWPRHALEEVFEMVRHAIIDSIMELESRNLRTTRIALGRSATDFWNARWRGEARYRPGTIPSGRGVVGLAEFYGASVIDDAFRDRVVGDGICESDIRVITDGDGSLRCALLTKDEPYALRNVVAVLGHNGRRAVRHFSYSNLQNMAIRDDERMPQMVAQANQSFGTRVDTVVTEWRASTAPPTPPKPKPRKEMTPLMVAWLT